MVIDTGEYSRATRAAHHLIETAAHQADATPLDNERVFEVDTTQMDMLRNLQAFSNKKEETNFVDWLSGKKVWGLSAMMKDHFGYLKYLLQEDRKTPKKQQPESSSHDEVLSPSFDWAPAIRRVIHEAASADLPPAFAVTRAEFVAQPEHMHSHVPSDFLSFRHKFEEDFLKLDMLGDTFIIISKEAYDKQTREYTSKKPKIFFDWEAAKHFFLKERERLISLGHYGEHH